MNPESEIFAQFSIYKNPELVEIISHSMNFENVHTMMRFVFSIPPDCFSKDRNRGAAFQITSPVRFFQGGSEIARLDVSDRQTPMETFSNMPSGMYLYLNYGAQYFQHVTGLSLNEIPRFSFDDQYLTLARLFDSVDHYEYSPGYRRVQAEAHLYPSSSANDNAYLPKSMVETVEVQQIDGKPVTCRERLFLPSVAGAWKCVTANDPEHFSRFDSVGKGDPSRTYLLQSVSLYSHGIHSPDAKMSEVRIDEVIKQGISNEITGVFLEVVNPRFDSIASLASYHQLDFEKFAHYKGDSRRILLSEAKYDSGLHYYSDPAWNAMYENLSDDNPAAKIQQYDLVVKSSVYNSNGIEVKNLSDRYVYPSLDLALLHMLDLNIRSMDLNYCKQHNIPSHITAVEIMDCYDQVTAMVVRNDGFDLDFPGTPGVYLIVNHKEMIELLEAAGLGVNPNQCDFQLGQYDNTNLVATDQYHILRSHTSIASELPGQEIVLETEKMDRSAGIARFGLKMYNSQQPDGIEIVSDGLTFDQAYDRLKEFPHENIVLFDESSGDFKLCITDKEGNPVVSRFFNPTEVLFPTGVYTMIHTQYLTPEIIAGVSRDLEIVASHSEYFICQSRNGEIMELKRLPSPLKTEDLRKEGGSMKI